MKYCNKCKVNVHHQLSNCPLCGSYLDERDNNDNCTIYQGMDQLVAYPILHEIKSTNFFRYKFNRILLVIAVFCVLLNLLLTPQQCWSAYVCIAVVFAIFCVMTPINAKSKITTQIRTDIVTLTVLSVVMEFSLCNWSFNWYCVEYILPWIYAASIVLTDVLIAAQRHSNHQLFSTLLFCTVFATIPQILLWIMDYLNIYHPKTLINFVIFFASIINIIIVFLVCSRSLKEEMERNLLL